MKNRSAMKAIVIPLVFIVIVCAVSLVIFRKETPDICTPIVPHAQSQERVNLLDHQAGNFASTTVDLIGRSAEGGTQKTFSENGVRRIVEQRFYGESGKSYMRFYYSRDKIFEIVKLNFTYAVPISVDSAGNVISSEERDYYLDVSGRVWESEVNGDTQSGDKETQEMIQEYIAAIL